MDGGQGAGEEQEEEDRCLYVMIDSLDRLQLNVTPQAIAVLKDVVEVSCCLSCINVVISDQKVKS